LSRCWRSRSSALSRGRAKRQVSQSLRKRAGSLSSSPQLCGWFRRPCSTAASKTRGAGEVQDGSAVAGRLTFYLLCTEQKAEAVVKIEMAGAERDPRWKEEACAERSPRALGPAPRTATDAVLARSASSRQLDYRLKVLAAPQTTAVEQLQGQNERPNEEGLDAPRPAPSSSGQVELVELQLAPGLSLHPRASWPASALVHLDAPCLPSPPALLSPSLRTSLPLFRSFPKLSPSNRLISTARCLAAFTQSSD
jgi:hypothetical protein